MKRIFLSTALALALSGTAVLAQQPAPPQDNGAPTQQRHFHHRDPQRQAEFLSKKLNLTPDQTAKLTSVFASRDQQFQALRQNTSLTPEQRHEQMHALMESTHQQLATVLTPDQIEQMKAMRHNRRHGHGQNPDQNPDAQPQQPGL